VHGAQRLLQNAGALLHTARDACRGRSQHLARERCLS
jgi:hypothetical protein